MFAVKKCFKWARKLDLVGTNALRGADYSQNAEESEIEASHGEGAEQSKAAWLIAISFIGGR
jgi:hypothetical protein